MPDTRPPLLHRLARIANRIRTRGPGEVWSLVGDRLHEAWNSEEALILNVRAATPMTREGPGLHVRQAGAADAARYAEDIGTDSPSSFSARLRPDVMCFVVEGDGRFLHATWVTTTGAWTREIAAYLVPPSGDAYVYESFTRADARGRGIYPFALAGIVTAMGEAGCAQMWVGVEARNAASRRAIAKADFEEAFTIEYRRRRGRLHISPPKGPKAAQAAAFIRRDAKEIPLQA